MFAQVVHGVGVDEIAASVVSAWGAVSQPACRDRPLADFTSRWNAAAMAYDEQLAARVRDVLAGDLGLSEQKMFGGLAFMLDGRMCCGIVGDRLMLRLGADLASEVLELPHVEPMDFTGKPMSTMVYVQPAGLVGGALRSWIEKAAVVARTAPAKRRRAVRSRR